MTMTLRRFTTAIVVWWLVVTALSITQFSPFGLLNIVGFPFIVLVPGYVTVLLLRLSGQSFITKLFFAVGFSLIELLAVALCGNMLLPHIGLAHPLDRIVLLSELSILVFVQLALLAWQAKKRSRQVIDDALHIRWIIPDNLNGVFAVVPFVFVVLSMAGAMNLNNGGGNELTIIMLIGAVLYFGSMLACLRRLNDGTMLIGITFTALALLLMTSLRGWHTTGHDIQREFHVFMLTQQAGLWSIDVLRDAYNACLSITILPTILHNLLSIESNYVYEIFFQFLFALTPAIVFMIARRFFGKFVALLAAIVFIAFPAFYGDMPMLNRQEIAFLFTSLALLGIFTQGLTLRQRMIIFYTMSLGIIVSHYSTNYTFLAILVVIVCSRTALWVLAHIFKKGLIYRFFNLSIWRKPEKSVITFVGVVALVAASFLWSVQFTHTAGDSLIKVARDTLQNITLTIQSESAGTDDEYSYVELRKLSNQEKLERYFQQSREQSLQKYGADHLYDPVMYDGFSYQIIDEPPVALTAIGSWLHKTGVPVDFLAEGPRAGNADIRQGIARVMQIMIVIGVVTFFLSRRYNKTLTSEYRLLQFASIFLLIVMIALPVLSAAYGLSRAFLQILIVASVPMVVGILDFFRGAWKNVGRAAMAAIILVFFISLTGLPTGLLGGYTPQLHLFNAGQYYDMYYTHDAEAISAGWLHDLVAKKDPSASIQADQVFIDRYTNLGLGNLSMLDDAYPGVIRKDSYVYLGYTATTKHQATIFYNGNSLTYQYPVDFLNQQKNLIYSNGGSEIYR